MKNAASVLRNRRAERRSALSDAAQYVHTLAQRFASRARADGDATQVALVHVIEGVDDGTITDDNLERQVEVKIASAARAERRHQQRYVSVRDIDDAGVPLVAAPNEDAVIARVDLDALLRKTRAANDNVEREALLSDEPLRVLAEQHGKSEDALYRLRKRFIREARKLAA